MIRNIRKAVLPVIFFVSDIAGIYISFIFAYWLRFESGWLDIPLGIPPFELYHSSIFVVIFLWIILFMYIGFYRERHVDALNEFLVVFKGVFFGTLVIAAITFIYRDFTFSRLMLGLSSVISLFVIYAFREIINVIDYYIGEYILGKHNVLVLGSGKIMDDIKKILKKKRNFNVHYSQYIDQEHLKGIIKSEKIHEIIFSKVHTAHNEILKVSDMCEDLGVDFRFVPDILELSRGELAIDEFLGIPVFRLKAVSLYGWNFFLKRLVDIVFSILILLLTIVPLVIIAVIIKLGDGGPVFYKHKRRGYKGKDFDFLKFRTMVMDADVILDKIRHLSERKGPVFKMKNDPRVTKIGKMLRRYSLDEMPQFLNVLRGEMSIVGPRPQVLWEAKQYDEVAERRLKVLPGITGLWQIRGRSDVSYEEMIRLDTYYIENWSIAMDIKIIFKTIPAILSGKGAY